MLKLHILILFIFSSFLGYSQTRKYGNKNLEISYSTPIGDFKSVKKLRVVVSDGSALPVNTLNGNRFSILDNYLIVDYCPKRDEFLLVEHDKYDNKLSIKTFNIKTYLFKEQKIDSRGEIFGINCYYTTGYDSITFLYNKKNENGVGSDILKLTQKLR